MWNFVLVEQGNKEYLPKIGDELVYVGSIGDLYINTQSEGQVNVANMAWVRGEGVDVDGRRGIIGERIRVVEFQNKLTRNMPGCMFEVKALDSEDSVLKVVHKDVFFVAKITKTS